LVVPFNNDEVTYYNINDYDTEVIDISEPLLVNINEINDFIEIAIKKGKFNIINGDTILPPMKFIPGKPKLIKAGKPGYKYDALTNISNINRDQNLPNSFIKRILIDDNDIVWFATAGGGIISYDGQYFQQFTKDEGLPDDDIYNIIMDSKGRLWGGSHRGGLFCYDGKYMTVYSKDQGLKHNLVISVFEDSDGIIWAGSYSGLIKINNDELSYSVVDQILDEHYLIWNIYEDNSGNMWFASRMQGLLKLRGDTLSHITTKTGLPSNRTLYVFEDSKSNMWFSTNGDGISKYNGKEYTIYGYDQGLGNDIVLSIDEDNYGNLWMATNGNGVTRFDGEAFRSYIDEDGLMDNYIRTVYVDKYNDLWIGTDGMGLSILKPGRFMQLNKKHGLTNDLVLSIYQDHKGRIWLGTFDGGIIIYELPKEQSQDHKMIKISTDEGLPDSLIVSITQDKDSNYLIATFRGGMSKIDYDSFEKGKLKITNYSTENGLNSNNVNKVLKDNNDNIWIGTRLGPCVLTDTGFISFNVDTDLNEAEIVEIFEDDHGDILLGSYGSGLFKFNSDSLYQYTTSTGLADNAIWTIKQSDSNVLMLGTDMGLQCIRNNKSFILNTYQGLSNNQVYSITEVPGNGYWLGTTVGLNHVDMDFSKKPSKIVESISSYDKYDGLISDDFYHNSALYDNWGWLWFGTLKGLIRFNPNRFTNRKEAPGVHLKDIAINNFDYDFIKIVDKNNFQDKTGITFDSVSNYSNLPVGLELPHELNHITFYISGTDWNTPSKVSLEYMLDGVDKNWTRSMGNNKVDYRNLTFGNYTFRLKSASVVGVQSDEIIYKFKILRPWYLTWWAILIYISLFVFIIYFIVKLRVSSIQGQKMILEKTVQERTKDLDNALLQANEATDAKSKFIATISHELRTPLNAITGLSHLALRSTIDTKLEDYLRKIDGSAKTLLSLINEILDFSKIESGKMKLESSEFDLENVLSSVIELNAQAAQSKGLKFVIEIDRDVPRKLVGDSLRLNQIITNLCNNAIKFTNKGEVVLKIEKEEEINKNEIFLHISVRDTGIGVSPEQKEKLFESFQQADTSITRKYGGTGLGLSIAKLFIEMMDGEIWLESEENKGSIFHLNIKLGIQYQNGFRSDMIIEKVLKKFSFLVVQESALSTEIITKLFDSYSINYSIANSGVKAKELLKDRYFDMIIIDNDLKDMSGIDFLLNIPSNIKSKDIKSLLIGDISSNFSGLEQNVTSINGTITKPFLPGSLFEKIYQILDISNSNKNDNIESSIHISSLKEKLAGIKVLITEDNELNSQVLMELLHSIGINTERATDGGQAISKVFKSKYDLIFMDLHMPVIDGFMATREIRKQGITTPIIAVTADLMESVRKKCTEVGISDILSKPIDPDYLYSRIESWISDDYELDSTASKKVHAGIINIDDGIKRMGGKKDLYYKMILKFQESMFSTIKNIEDLFNKHDYNEAAINMHSFKGETGNLGIYSIAELASEIETLIQNQDHKNFSVKIVELNDKLGHIDEEIKKNEKLRSFSDVTEFRPDNEVLEDLKSALDKNSPMVFNLLDEIEDKIVSDEFIKLKNYILKGEIELAKDLISKILEDL
jgi:signal transduction histidine kinase/ligand-binding sensor domain-containing protein/DNA-binding response OmpR family regulator